MYCRHLQVPELLHPVQVEHLLLHRCCRRSGSHPHSHSHRNHFPTLVVDLVIIVVVGLVQGLLIDIVIVVVVHHVHVMLERGVLGIRLAVTTEHPCESSTDLLRRQLPITH